MAISFAIISWAYFKRSPQDEGFKDNKIEFVLKFILGEHNLNQIK